MTDIIVEITPYANLSIDSLVSKPIDSKPISGTIEAFKLVIINELGQLEKATVTNLSHCNKVVGITINELGSFQSSGIISNPNWNLSVGKPLYAGSNGDFLEVPLNTGLWMGEIGISLSPTEILINIKEAIEF